MKRLLIKINTLKRIKIGNLELPIDLKEGQYIELSIEDIKRKDLTMNFGFSYIGLIFADFNINEISWWSLFLLAAFIQIILYEIYWIRYFKSEKTMKDIIISGINETNYNNIT